jgi:uncharacterized protein
VNRFIEWFHKKFVEPLVSSANPPWFDARGVSIGLIIGLGTPIGAHTVVLVLLRFVFRFNLLAAYAFSWVCNPFNMIFVYYGYYWLGSVLLHRPFNMDFHVFRKLIDPIAEQGHFWETLAEFAQLGEEILVRWLVAAVLFAIIFGILGYLITYRIQKKRFAKKIPAENLEKS